MRTLKSAFLLASFVLLFPLNSMASHKIEISKANGIYNNIIWKSTDINDYREIKNNEDNVLIFYLATDKEDSSGNKLAGVNIEGCGGTTHLAPGTDTRCLILAYQTVRWASDTNKPSQGVFALE